MKRQFRFAGGQMALVLTLALPALLAAVGLAADIGVLYFNWVQLQKAADAAALAGAEYLVATPLPTPAAVPSPACGTYPTGGQTANAESAACTYVTYNNVAASAVQSISVPAPNPPASVPAGVQTIQVVLSKPDVPTYFLKMVGLSSLAVKAQATAMAPSAICGAGNGMFPVGMPETPPGYANWQDTVGQTITLAEGVAPGDWEWINIPTSNYVAPSTQTTTTGGGDTQLASTITTGCVDCSVNVNDYLTPEPGNQGSSDPVTSAIDNRVTASWENVSSSCSGTVCTNSGPPSSPPPAGAPQFVTLPVVDWSSANGASSAVQVVGFVTAWIVGYTRGGNLMVDVIGTAANTQVSGGSCTPSYPGFTQAELVQ
jgi:Flp pilus assembly protein TadG